MTASKGTAVPRQGEGNSSRKGTLLFLVFVGAIVIFGVLAYEYGIQSTAPPSTSESSSNSTNGVPSFMQATCSSLPQTSTGQVEHQVSGGIGSHAYFLIVEADPPSPFAGINGSYYVAPSTQWPIMNVKLGNVVSIHVVNCASSESHGFQITYYDDINKNLISIPPGQSYDVTFTALKAGTFRVYCGIFCSIHPLMQNGALVVT